MPPGARHRQTSLFERLAQRFEGVPAELHDLIHEENAAVSTSDLPRSRRRPASADQGGRRNAVVGSAKRRDLEQTGAGGQHPNTGRDRGHLDGLAPAEWGQDPGERPGQQRLARSRRTDQ